MKLPHPALDISVMDIAQYLAVMVQADIVAHAISVMDITQYLPVMVQADIAPHQAVMVQDFRDIGQWPALPLSTFSVL